MAILAKFSTLAGGCFIEVVPGWEGEDHSPEARCFRFDAEGRAEYVRYRDVFTGTGPLRWYGSVLTQADFVLA